ncbi:MAG: Asp23/Gls24 family envelope stress response protein [Nocardioidaceae bacterium]|nr:Asp23/Gls24 family envelope stress response protein [Nocardioidaceae bacterium]
MPVLAAASSPPPAFEPVEGLAAAVQSCAGVASLSGGTFGEVATYLPGRRVRGVRLTDETVEVHIVAFWGPPLPPVAAQIRVAAAPFAGSRTIDVYIDDLLLPDTTTAQE